ncbi:hypothetical protein ACFLZ9_00395 [Patescibacteria group bacterium]
MENRRGKFIVIYGVNNLGKTTQAKMLVERLSEAGLRAEYIKYPIYDLSPSGELLNNYLREGNSYNLTAREAQKLYVLNRTQYENTLEEKLNAGIYIIAEDYSGTGIAWGIGAGVDEKYLKHINSHLLKEDIAILFDGHRFTQAIENNHQHETNEYLIKTVRHAHLLLAQEYNWIKINANQSINQIHEQVWEKISPILSFQTNFYKNMDFKKLHDQYFNKAHKLTIGLQDLLIQQLHIMAKIPTIDQNLLNLYSTDYYSISPNEKINIKTGVRVIGPEKINPFIKFKSPIQEVHILSKHLNYKSKNELLISLINKSSDFLHIAPNDHIAQIEFGYLY